MEPFLPIIHNKYSYSIIWHTIILVLQTQSIHTHTYTFIIIHYLHRAHLCISKTDCSLFYPAHDLLYNIIVQCRLIQRSNFKRLLPRVAWTCEWCTQCPPHLYHPVIIYWLSSHAALLAMTIIESRCFWGIVLSIYIEGCPERNLTAIPLHHLLYFVLLWNEVQENWTDQYLL